MVNIYVMGKKYTVPSDLTIMRAMELIGYRFIRGCGCRAGFCGACATVYRFKDDYRLRVGLACMTLVQEGMYLTQIPFFPAQRPRYDLNKLSASPEQIYSLYPEIFRCIGCNSCTKICPQEIEVMEVIASAIRGDISRAAILSFDCIMCGLCAARCPAEIAPYNVAILCRRLYGKYIARRSPHVKKRVEEIRSGMYDQRIQELMGLPKHKLMELHAQYQKMD